MRGIVVTALLVACGTAHAATPCDFKGIGVGDTATPQQIMAHYGITKFTTADPSRTDAERNAASQAMLSRANKVGLTNAAEEDDRTEGPACREAYCRIPYGLVTVGEKPYPIYVDVFVSFDSTHRIKAIDVGYDKLQWDEVLELLNTKYGDNWRKEEVQDLTTDYQTKKSESDTVTILTHRNPGANPKTGDRCTIRTVSRDIIWLHTMPPVYRAELEIKLVSKNF